MRIGLGGVSLFPAVVAAAAYGAELGQGAVPATVERSAQHVIQSVSVGDTLLIQVRLPASYAASEKKYQVLYVLDGDKCFGVAADRAEWLAWAKEAPELIVVGVGYSPGRDWRQRRSRNLTLTQDATRLWGEWPLAGGAGKFKDFLANIPVRISTFHRPSSPIIYDRTSPSQPVPGPGSCPQMLWKRWNRRPCGAAWADAPGG